MSRQLSPGEKSYFLHDVYIIMESQTENKIPSKEAKRACEILQQEHPFLRSIIEKQGNTYQFRLLKNPPFHFTETSLDHENFIHELMNRKVDRSILCEFIIISHPKGDTFVTYIHHAIADGASTHYLHQRFFNLIEQLERKKEIQPIKNYPLPPVLAKKIPLSYQKSDPKTLAQKYGIGGSNEKRQYLPSQFQKNLKKEVFRIEKLISQSQTFHFKKLCKKNKVSMNSGLCAALLMTAAKKINSKEKNFVLSHDVPVNTRPYLNPPVPNSVLATYNSVFFSNVNFSPSSTFWEIAKSIQENTKKALQTEALYEMIQALNSIYQFEETEENPEQIFLYTTNLGVINFSNQKYKVKGFSVHASCLVPFLVTFNTYQDKLKICFIYTTPFLTREFMDSFSKSFLGGIEDELKRN